MRTIQQLCEELRLPESESSSTKAKTRQPIVACEQIPLAKLIYAQFISDIAAANKEIINERYVKMVCMKIADHLTSTDFTKPISLYIYGPVGSGKSTMFNATRTVMSKLYQEGLSYSSSVSITSRAYYKHTMAGYDLVETMMSHRVIMIDDLGFEEPTGMVYGTRKNPLEDLIKTACDQHKPMIITSNLDIPGIGKQFNSERLEDCLYAFSTLQMNHKSFRRL